MLNGKTPFFHRKKLTQLQHAYTCLFRDYDSKLKSEVKIHFNIYLPSFAISLTDTYPNICVFCVFQGGDLCGRLEEAERALALKQDLIDKLKEEVEQQKGSLETVPVLTAQVQSHREARSQ